VKTLQCNDILSFAPPSCEYIQQKTERDFDLFGAMQVNGM